MYFQLRKKYFFKSNKNYKQNKNFKQKVFYDKNKYSNLVYENFKNVNNQTIKYLVSNSENNNKTLFFFKDNIQPSSYKNKNLVTSVSKNRKYSTLIFKNSNLFFFSFNNKKNYFKKINYLNIPIFFFFIHKRYFNFFYKIKNYKIQHHRSSLLNKNKSITVFYLSFLLKNYQRAIQNYFKIIKQRYGFKLLLSFPKKQKDFILSLLLKLNKDKTSLKKKKKYELIGLLLKIFLQFYEVPTVLFNSYFGVNGLFLFEKISKQNTRKKKFLALQSKFLKKTTNAKNFNLYLKNIRYFSSVSKKILFLKKPKIILFNFLKNKIKKKKYKLSFFSPIKFFFKIGKSSKHNFIRALIYIKKKARSKFMFKNISKQQNFIIKNKIVAILGYRNLKKKINYFLKSKFIFLTINNFFSSSNNYFIKKKYFLKFNFFKKKLKLFHKLKLDFYKV